MPATHSKKLATTTPETPAMMRSNTKSQEKNQTPIIATIEPNIPLPPQQPPLPKKPGCKPKAATGTSTEGHLSPLPVAHPLKKQGRKPKEPTSDAETEPPQKRQS